jgi:hypothetical protein
VPNGIRRICGINNNDEMTSLNFSSKYYYVTLEKLDTLLIFLTEDLRFSPLHENTQRLLQ